MTDSQRKPFAVHSELTRNEQLSTIVLCGGHSSRMGVDKAMVRLGERTLLQHVVANAQEIGGPVVVVGAEGQKLPHLPDSVIVVRDVIQDEGPMCGLLTGLQEIGQRSHVGDRVWLTACDTPFVDAEIVETLSNRLGSSDVSVIWHSARMNPLIGIYRRSNQETLQRHFDAGERSLTKWLQQVSCVHVPAADFSSEKRFLNVNSPESLQAAHSYLDQSRSC